MKKSALEEIPKGSAQEVMEHARFRRSRGHNPSKSFVGVRNPRKALALTASLIDARMDDMTLPMVDESTRFIEEVRQNT